MKISWTVGLDKDLIKELRGDFVSSKIVRHRLSKMLEEKIKAARAASLSKDGYDNPSWAYKQADQVGYERAMNEVILLVSDTD